MANAIKLNEGTVKVFTSTGGDATFTFTSVANGAGRLSAQLDLGAAPRAKWYRWVLTVKMASGGAGTLLRPYLVEASSAATTYQDALAGLSDAAVASEVIYQYGGKLLGPCLLQTTGTAAQVWSGKCRIFSRYVSLMLWNATGVAASATGTDHVFRLEPVYDEVQ